jgi:hypothetical protein
MLSIFFEVWGIFKMARRYTEEVGFFQMFVILGSALIRGRIANGAARFSELNKEQALYTLQGLSFIAVGFGLRAVPYLIGVFNPEWLTY